ncbi:MAG: putative Glucose/ribitol dehydrogenase [Gammaproteobacteria bacterium]|jgi:NAD(P)-dependent dehydrogenase (short-subunit alcohol dehydrogenase family)|nr:putative Glucose/ribitol dehydrogenase [Gammaproteobacteria bacterium]
MFKGKTIWITGASSGIGRAVATELAKQGARLAISGRNKTALQELKQSYPEQIELVVAFDVTDLNANIAAAQLIEKQFGRLDKVFFNAGTSQHMDVKNFQSETFEQMIKVNYLSLVYGIEAALPLLRKAAHSHIIGMSSMAGYHGMPLGEAYSAAKAATRNLLQGLQIDLREEGIAVSIVCPGFVATPLTDKHDFAMPLLLTADQAAKIIVKGIYNKKPEIAFPKPMIWAAKLLGLLPFFITARLLARAKYQAEKSKKQK